MTNNDNAIARLVDRLLELFMKKSTPQKYGNVMFEAAEVIQQLKKKTAPPPNDPLTMEQLREMGKDWVWIDLLVPLYGMNSGYYIKHPRFSDVDKFCCGYPGVVIRSIPYSGYGDTWIAYRRKPEDERT